MPPGLSCSLAVFGSIEHLGRLGTLPCTRGEAGAADGAQARLLFSDSNILSAMLYTNRTFHYVQMLHGQK